MLLITSTLASLLLANQLLVSFYLRNIDITYDVTTSQMIYDNELGYITSPNDNFSHGGITYSTDSFSERSFNNENTDFKKPTILLVGDSHVWGWGKDAQDTIKSKLELLLKKNGHHLQVRTISDINYSSVQTYLKFLRDFRNYQSITAVIWVNGHNDSYNNSQLDEHRVSRPSIAFHHEDTPCRYNTPPKRPLYFSRERWANESMFKDKYAISMNPAKLEILDFFSNIVRDIFMTSADIKRCTNEVIDGDKVLVYLNKLMFGLATKHNAKFLSIFVPNKLIHSTSQSYNNIFISELNSSGIAATDINTEITDKGIPTIFSASDDHLSAIVHELIAEKIFSFLKLE